MRVSHIDHVNIRTPLFEETLAFYEAVLGLRRGPAASTIARRQNSWLYNADGAALIHVNGPQGEEAVPVAGRVGRLDHFALACDDLAGFRARLAALGIPYREVPLPARQLVQLNLADPNGIAVELTFAALDEPSLGISDNP